MIAQSIFAPRFGRRRRIILHRHAHRWSVQIIKLTGLGRPRKRCDKRARDENGQRQHDEQHAHTAAPFRTPKVLARTAMASTLRLAMGMMIAASNGEMCPVMHNAAATMLYSTLAMMHR